VNLTSINPSYECTVLTLIRRLGTVNVNLFLYWDGPYFLETLLLGRTSLFGFWAFLSLAHIFLTTDRRVLWCKRFLPFWQVKREVRVYFDVNTRFLTLHLEAPTISAVF
jgi:hypothetical protein